MDYLHNNVPEAHGFIGINDGGGMEGREGKDSHWSELSEHFTGLCRSFQMALISGNQLASDLSRLLSIAINYYIMADIFS